MNKTIREEYFIKFEDKAFMPDFIKIVNHISTKKQEDIERLIKDYFSLESLGVPARKPANDPEERALNILNRTVRQQVRSWLFMAYG